ncbi:MAG: NlpC/P60 family protein [Glaciecola sp.]
MNEKDWIEEVSGKSWQDRATGPDAYDCWGLVVDFYRRVKGFEIENIAGYVNGETGINQGFKERGEGWQPSELGYVAVCFDGDNANHVGVRIGGRVIHAFGGVKRDGQVFNHTLSQFNRIYRGNVKYFDYIERV